MAAPTNYIEQHVAEDAVIDRIVDILQDNFGADLDDLFNRDGAYTGAPGANDTGWTEGVYVPSLDSIYRQVAPTTEQEKDVGHVSAFVGPIGPAERVNEKAEGGDVNGYVWQFQQPFAVTIVFGRTPQKVVKDPTQPESTARYLREEELVRKRASYYAGGIAHTLFRYARGTTAIAGIVPDRRSSQNIELQIGENEYALIGVGSFEFTVVNHQLFPDFA